MTNKSVVIFKIMILRKEPDDGAWIRFSQTE